MNILNIGMSGMNAAATKLAVAASNIVNAQSYDYTPVAVENNSAAGGGVEAVVRPVEPSTVPAVASDSSIAAMPNVDLAEEVINMMIAKTAYKSSAKIVEAAQDMSQELLDIKK